MEILIKYWSKKASLKELAKQKVKSLISLPSMTGQSGSDLLTYDNPITNI